VDIITQRLEDQRAERAKTIEKLKAATKYDSTQELLEKYGGAPPKPKPKPERKSTTSTSSKQAQKQPQRTSLGPPPPTANIPRPDNMPPPNQIISQPSTPQPFRRQFDPYAAPPPAFASPQAEFAPNAFPAPPQYALGDSTNLDGHWYDRVLDLLLGEDETSPKNRLVLICQNCRLVNGQAPPGTKTLSDLGKWRCFGCGTLNGEEDEAVKAVKEMKERITETHDESTSAPESKSELGSDAAESGDLKEGEDGVDKEAVEQNDDSGSDTIEVKPRKGKSKGSRKKA
jgi:hypothetical protein